VAVPDVKHPDLEWESAVCPLCGPKPQETFYRDCPDRLHGLPGSFTYVRCTGCGLVLLNPRPTEVAIAAYYPSDYPEFSLEERHQESALERVVQDIIQPRFPSPQLGLGAADRKSRILDIGCGAGGYLKHRAREGWEAWGIEPDAAAAELTRQDPNITRVITGGISDTAPEIPREYFDLVSFRDVLEHLHDPLSSIQFALDVLVPGGYIEIFTPDVASLEARLFGKDWFPIEAPRHVFLYSKMTLCSLLARVGFQVSAFRPSYTAGNAYLSFCYLYRSTFGNSLNSNSAVRKLLFIALTPITVLLALIGKSGGGLEIWARKPL
jgi:SAM-dependent methyltransferase